MQVAINFMGEDFIADVDYIVTFRGSPGTPPSLNYPGDPPEYPEWEYDSIILFRDLGGDALGPGFEATGGLLDCLGESDRIVEAVFDDIAKDYTYDYYD